MAGPNRIGFIDQPFAELIISCARVSLEPYTVVTELKALWVDGGTNVESEVPRQ